MELKDEIFAFHYFKAAPEQVFGVQLLKSRNHLLIHGQQDRNGVRWKIENLYKLLILRVTRREDHG